MIDLTIHPDRLATAIQRVREQKIIIPTFKQQRNPQLIPPQITAQLKKVGLWDLNPLNLFRITWHNEPIPSGGGFGGVNFIEFPAALTGVKARILAPVITRMSERADGTRRMPRGLAIIMCYLVFLGSIVGFGYIFIPSLAKDFARIGKEAPLLYKKVNEEWTPQLA